MPDPQAMTPEQVRVGVAAIEWFHTIDNWGGPECSPKEGFEFASVTGDLLILETHVDLLDHRRAAMAFYPGGELGGDVTNWWGPNGPGPVAPAAMHPRRQRERPDQAGVEKDLGVWLVRLQGEVAGRDGPERSGPQPRDRARTPRSSRPENAEKRRERGEDAEHGRRGDAGDSPNAGRPGNSPSTPQDIELRSSPTLLHGTAQTR